MEQKVKTIGIVSLSRGILGESFIRHELYLGLKRLEEMGIYAKMLDHALLGMDFIEKNPGSRAEDFVKAMADDRIDMVLCAIGGDDTYRLLPYLFDNDEFKNRAKQKPFLGFSDSTFNHFMLNKIGIKSFYGQSFLVDVCELAPEMLKYSKKYFTELIETKQIKEITPSDVWYENRTDFSPNAVGTPLVEHPNNGFQLLQGKNVFSGQFLGGCIDSIHDMFNNSRYADTVELCDKYQLFPSKEEWKNKILLLETSEEKMAPAKYRETLMELKKRGIFDVINGICMGKPCDEVYDKEYKEIIQEVVDNKDLPIVANLNIGHALPHCIIPFGVDAVVDVEKQIITFKYE